MPTDDRGRVDTVAAVFVPGDPARWSGTVESLRRALPGSEVVCGGPDAEGLQPLAGAGGAAVHARSAADLVNGIHCERGDHVLLAAHPALLPEGALDVAVEVLAADLRVATVSFLSNWATFLSFPERNRPLGHSLDAEATTRRLRSATHPLSPFAVAFATGPVVLLAGPALTALGGLDEGDGWTAEEAIVDFSGRARRRGFLDLADPRTFVTRVRDDDEPDDVWSAGIAACAPTVARRHPFLSEVALDEAALPDSPVGVVHPAARAAVRGVRLLVDATWAGPWEMGTQVQTIALLEALSRQPDVETVFVALGFELPPTVDAVLANPRLQPRAVLAGDLSGFGEVDVVHRPFQTDGALDIGQWRKVGARTVLTVLDLIGYHVGAYHDSGPHWAAFRRALRTAVSVVDGIVVPAADVANQVRLERLPIEADRLFEVGLGTDHLVGDEPQSPPPEVVARGLGSRGFLLVLGADYAHKNRDLALRAFTELGRRGFTGGLVMAGPVIPQGKGAARAPSDADGVLVLPHVRPAERNWLLAHAALVLYPTSAEGFGLVPYEAARFGTPTVLVPVGPLEVVAADLPVLAAGWSAAAMADAAERLLADADLATAQVAATVRSADRQRWDDTAARLVEVYRSLLARPTVGGHARAGPAATT